MIVVHNPPSTSATTSALALNQHVISADFTIPDGHAVYVSRYVKIEAGVTLEVGDDADLEIG